MFGACLLEQPRIEAHPHGLLWHGKIKHMSRKQCKNSTRALGESCGCAHAYSPAVHNISKAATGLRVVPLSDIWSSFGGVAGLVGGTKPYWLRVSSGVKAPPPCLLPVRIIHTAECQPECYA
eukprot:COSAG03_NODE_316_length_9052_cov_3.462080_2_plen_122_part_00